MNVPEKHKAVAHAWIDGAEIEGRNTTLSGREWVVIRYPVWHEDLEYRIKPTKPSINWEHVAPEYVALATDSDGSSYLFTEVPEATASTWTAACPCKSAEVFQSFVKGTCDWKDSLVLRTLADSEKDAEDAAPSPTTAHAPTPKLEWSETLANGVQKGEWPHTIDAQVWARKWLEITADKPEIATDEGAMIGWFANAIMAGYDTAMLVSNP